MSKWLHRFLASHQWGKRELLKKSNCTVYILVSVLLWRKMIPIVHLFTLQLFGIIFSYQRSHKTRQMVRCASLEKKKCFVFLSPL